jgi:hypothetical protein
MQEALMLQNLRNSLFGIEVRESPLVPQGMYLLVGTGQIQKVGKLTIEANKLLDYEKTLKLIAGLNDAGDSEFAPSIAKQVLEKYER